MKALLLIAAMVFFFSACDNGKGKENNTPLNPAGVADYVSPEKARLNTAMENAQANGKKVLVKIAAAWCSPCMALDDDIAANRGEFDSLLKDYEFISFEQMHWHTFSGLMDFMPTYSVTYYPSLFVVDPATGKWTYLRGAYNVEGLKTALASVETAGVEMVNGIQEKLNSENFGESVHFSPDDYDALYDLGEALLVASYEFSKEDALAFFHSVLKKAEEYPNNFDLEDGTLSYIMRNVEQNLAAKGMDSGTLYKLPTRPQTAARALDLEIGALGNHIKTNGHAATYGICSDRLSTISSDYAEQAQAETQAAVNLENEVLSAAESELSEAQTNLETLRQGEDQAAIAAAESAVQGAQYKVDDAKAEVLKAETLWAYKQLLMKLNCQMIGLLGKAEGVSSAMVNETITAASELGRDVSRLKERASFALAIGGDFDTAISILDQRISDEAKKYGDYGVYYQGQADELKEELKSLEEALAAATPDTEEHSELAAKVEETRTSVEDYEGYVVTVQRLDGRVAQALGELKQAWQSGTAEVSHHD